MGRWKIDYPRTLDNSYTMRDLLQFQKQSLRTLIQRLYDLNPGYRAKMEAAQLTPQSFSDLPDLQRFPFTQKEDLRQAYPFGYVTVPRQNLSRVHTSSGSLGYSTVSAYSQADIEAWSELMKDCLADAGVVPSDTILITHGYGLFTGGLGVHYGAEKLGCLVVPASSGQTSKQVQLIEDLGVSVLVGNPSYILKLAAAIRSSGRSRDKLQLRLCICGAEPWSENLRREIQSSLGVPAYDLYGISEVIGPGVAAEMAGRPGALVVREDHFYPEICDGELVISTLTKEAMPLLRYRTGDRTDWLPEFNSTFRAIRRISGRRDDMVKVKGVAIYPLQIEEILLNDPGLNGNYLIEISRPSHLDVLTIKAEEKRLGAVQASALVQALRAQLGITPEVYVLPPGSLPQTEGKAKRLIDLREKG